MSIHTNGYDHHLDEAYAVMERAGQGRSQFVIPGDVRTAMRHSDAPARVLHDFITGPLLADVLQEAQNQLDTLISPAGSTPPYLASHLRIADLIELARTIQDYAANVQRAANTIYDAITETPAEDSEPAEALAA